MVVSIELTDKIDYTKKPLTLAEQVARLKQRGLVFDDESEATAYLFNISYYRLRAYTYPFQENGEDSEHTFTRKDIHFKDIIDLYCFDRRLRSLIFNTIEKIEVAVRTKIVQVYAESTGDSHWFNDESLYRFGYDDLMDRIDADVNRSNEDFIKLNIYHVNMPKVFRLSEQYLIRAEAYCHLKEYTKAGKDITTLRSARYKTYGTTAIGEDNWLETISEERVRELFMEGFRLHDLKRWHKGFEREPQSNTVEAANSLKIEADHPLFVWPIPQHELDAPGSELQPNDSNN